MHLLDGHWQDAVAHVVNMLANQVYTTCDTASTFAVNTKAWTCILCCARWFDRINPKCFILRSEDSFWQVHGRYLASGQQTLEGCHKRR